MFQEGCPDPASAEFRQHVQLFDVQHVIHFESDDKSDRHVVVVERRDLDLSFFDQKFEVNRVVDRPVQVGGDVSPCEQFACRSFYRTETFYFVASSKAN